MARLEKWLAAIASLLVCAIVLLVLNLWVSIGAAGLPRMMPMLPMMGGSTIPATASNGERIFKTGTNARGEAIANGMMPGMGAAPCATAPTGTAGR